MLFHFFRCARQVARGQWLAPKLGFFEEGTTRLFCGIRLIDIFGHVNNARYLELCELARWQMGMQSGMNMRFFRGRCYPVVAASHLNFMAEIKPWTFVNIRSRVLSTDKRFLYMEQVVYSPDARSGGEKIHATVWLKIAILKAPGKPQREVPKPKSADGTGKPATKRSGPVLDINEALYRMGLTDDIEKLPEELVKLNGNIPHHVRLIAEGDESWRQLIRMNKEAKQ
jgi:acyl-CoA thioesterase FadM